MFSSGRFTLRSSPVLPTSGQSILANGDLRSAKGIFFPKRYTRLLFGCLLVLASVAVFLRNSPPEYTNSLPREVNEAEEREDVDEIPDLPPTYQEYIDYERNFPQHDLSLPSPEGRHAKFLWVRNHVTGMFRYFTAILC